MRKIIASTFVTLDGVMEAPGSGDVSLPEHAGWSMPFTNEEVGQFIFGQMAQSDAMLLGRQTYQEFAAYWSAQPAEDPFAQRMNGQIKYVVSNSLKSADWNNSTLINGNVVAALSDLKQQAGQNISIVGSGGLIRSLMPHNLIDEYWLLLCPVVLGAGKPLFAAGTHKIILRLAETKPFSSGMVALCYVPESK